jgi:heme exporter protein C
MTINDSNNPSINSLAAGNQKRTLFSWAAPANFYALTGKLIPWFAIAAVLLSVAGLYMGFITAPTDFQQGEVYRIIYIHVPSAWLAMVTYLAMAFWCAVFLIWKTRVSAIMAQALAPTGAMFAFVALWTGALWGRPTWGAYWVWDARLTSTLILLFLYLGFIALRSSIDDERKADKAAALLAIVGSINVPIIYFSVKWWNSLHQGASVSPTMAPKMAQTMLTAMMIMTLAVWCYAIAASLYRARTILLEREGGKTWLTKISSQNKFEKLGG